MQRPATDVFRLQPGSQAGGCFNISDGDTATAAPPGVSSEVYTEGSSFPKAAATAGGPVAEAVQRTSLDAMAGAMVRLLVALPLRDPPQFVQLPRWREATSGPAVAAVRGALDAPGLLYYAVRAPDHWTVASSKVFSLVHAASGVSWTVQRKPHHHSNCFRGLRGLLIAYEGIPFAVSCSIRSSRSCTACLAFTCTAVCLQSTIAPCP